jgi:hypothetical protein
MPASEATEEKIKYAAIHTDIVTPPKRGARMLYPETDRVKAITNMSEFDFRQARGYGAIVGGTGLKYQMHSSCSPLV